MEDTNENTILLIKSETSCSESTDTEYNPTKDDLMKTFDIQIDGENDAFVKDEEKTLLMDVRVGDQYQVMLPPLMSRQEYSVINDSKRVAQCVWTPPDNNNAENETSYLIKYQNLLYEAISKDQNISKRAVIAKYRIPLYNPKAYFVLKACKYNYTLAITRAEKFIAKFMDKANSKMWNENEVVSFETALTIYGKDFHQIQKCVATKTTQEVVKFYYRWKVTERRVYLNEFNSNKSKNPSDINSSILRNDFRVAQLIYPL
ncbi:hypothetical protein A3Q56_04098 [Intoshia linei]|uniref:SANT domain-containing protein n=1 Tax=Intoshia linei TaxID=1819745 RepID=A0A177B3H7_9BILA|nr:hypothetical protein A3Q56_04098 [Intoshia linei]